MKPGQQHETDKYQHVNRLNYMKTEQQHETDKYQHVNRPKYMKTGQCKNKTDNKYQHVNRTELYMRATRATKQNRQQIPTCKQD